MSDATATLQPVSGPLTFDTVPALLAGSGGWFAAAGGVTVDLQQVTQADSAGLALLLEWLRRARRAGCALAFVNIPPQMQVLIRVNGLTGVLQNGKAV
jgi:phospholipid transport system transporter-binding protein